MKTKNRNRIPFIAHRSSFIVIVLFLFCSSFLVPRSSLGEDVPAAINYQGRLTDNLGNALTSGYYHIEFRIWDHPTLAGAGDLIWGRMFPLHVMDGGIFNILLTDDGGAVTNPAPQTGDLRQAFAEEDRYLGLTITQTPAGAVPSPSEISPRQRLVSAPYAFYAQTATEAARAAMATFASNATHAGNADTVGNEAGTNFLHKSQFPGAQSPAKLIAWDGANAAAVQAYVAGSDLRANYAFAANALQATNGFIRPAVGTALNAGIEFPANPYGGAGDRAWIKYYVRTNAEDCTLQIGIDNDPGDRLDLYGVGGVDVRANGGPVSINTGSTDSQLLLRGQVKSLGGADFFGENDVDEIASCDAFYIVYVDNGTCDVDIDLAAGGSMNLYLRNIRDDDWNITTHTFPVAKGDRFHLHNRSQTQSGHDWYIKTWRRDMGHANP